jgi:hypothetical protein
MTIQVGECIETVVEMVLSDGTVANNIFHHVLQGENEQTDADCRTAIAASLNALYDILAPYISDAIVVNPAYLNLISWSSELQKWYTARDLGVAAMTWEGEGIQDSFPNQVAAVLTAATYLPKHNGRKFFPMFVETSAVAGDLISGALTALTAAGALYIEPLPLGGADKLTPCVASGDGGQTLTFASVVANSILGSCRRRKPGVGR